MSANGKQDTLAIVLRVLTEKVFKSPDCLLDHEEAQKPKLFSKSPPLHAIQTYVYCGLLYPHDEKEFDRKVPKDAFNGVLNTVLPELYDQTKNAILGVSKSCYAFDQNVLSQLVLHTDIIMKHCEAMKNLLQHKKFGLLTQLNTLMDTQFDGKENDLSFTKAKEAALYILGQMKNEAKTNNKKSSELERQCGEFYRETETNKARIETAEQSYNKPITVDKKQYKNVTQLLDAEYEAAEQREKDAYEYQKKYFDYVGKDKDYFTRFIDVLTSSEYLKSPLLVMSHAQDTTSIRANMYRCRRLVLNVHEQNKTLLELIQEAQRGMNTLAQAFHQQAFDIQLAIDNLEKIENGAHSGAGFIRRMDIEMGIDFGIEKYTEIWDAAKEFQQHARLDPK